VVIQVCVNVSNVVEAHTALGLKVIWAFGTVTLYVWSAVKVIIDPVKEIVAPVLGIPLAVKLALNQMKSPGEMAVPLKLEMFVEGPQVDCPAAELTNKSVVLRSMLADGRFINYVEPGSTSASDRQSMRY